MEKTVLMNYLTEREETGILLQRIFSNRWNEVFIIDAIKNEKYSYGDFFSMILRCREKLDELGLEPNGTICTIMNNSIQLIALYFASLTLGIPIISIDPNKGENEIKEILLSTRCKVIFSDSDDQNFPLNSLVFHTFCDNIRLQKNDDVKKLEIFLKINYNELFIITYTSGSTGKPKGVMHSFNNFVLSSLAFREKFEFNNENIFYHNLPMSYIGGILNLIILPLISESKIVIDEKFSITKMKNFWEQPIKYSVNTFWFIPTILSLLLKIDRSNDGVEYSEKNNIIGLVGTASLQKDLKTNFQEKYSIPLYESYALSETFFITTNFLENDKVESPGRLLDGVDLTFSKDKEILIEVPWMFLGYYGLDTKNYFIERKYQTGDLGEFDSEKFLRITGRKKDIIIKGGTNISPKRIEDFINSMNLVDEFIILGIDDEVLGEKIVCMFIAEDKQNKEFSKIINKKIVDKLGIEYHIDEFLKINEIPKNSNGKIDRIRARKKYQDLKI